MKQSTADLMERYRTEYVRTNGKAPSLMYAHGWFSVNGDKFRKIEFERMLATLKTRPTVVDRMEMVNGVSTLVKASQHVVKSLVGGQDVIEERDTPNCCSVASETYWSM